MIKSTKALSLKAVMLASAASFAVAGAHAQSADQQTIEFDIDAQDLGAALTEFGIQSGKEVYFVEADVNGKTTNGVEGQFTSDRAITIILADAGVPHTFDNNGTVLVGNEYIREASLSDGKTPQSFRVAQLDQEDDLRRVETGDEFTDERVEDTIVVTGTTIRGVYPDSAPLEVYTADDIALSGATTLNRFLETLPQNLNSSASGSFALLGAGVGGDPTDAGGVDLRGLDVGTTLILLNGRRLTSPEGESPNTSLIPLGAIERVEVLTDGASAIYGSDAIGGVVNFVLRDDFDGVDINTSYGTATRGGHDRAQVDAAAGKSWESGSGFLSFSYLTQSALDVSERDFSSQAPSPLSLIPDERAYNVMGAIDQNFTDKLKVFGNVLYSIREAEVGTSAAASLVQLRESDDEQLFLVGGIEYQFAEDLFFQIDATYLEREYETRLDTVATGQLNGTVENGESLDLLAKLDGKLFELPGGDAKFSLGGGYSEQDFRTAGGVIPNPPFDFDLGFNRDSYFGFAEAFLPIIGEEQDIPGVHRLEVSGAVRYTDYSDFGSAATPRFGVLWAPIQDVKLRGTYSRSFRAPTLRDLTPGTSFARILRLSDFGLPDTFSDDGSTVLFLANGPRLNGLEPEFSDTYTVGVDFEPVAIENLKISATYYSIDYTDRFGSPVPSATAALFDQENLAFLFNTSPTQQDLLSIASEIPQERILDLSGTLPLPIVPQDVANFVTVIFDNRQVNLASAATEGVDVSLDYGHDSAVGYLNYGVRLSHIINSTQQASPNAIDRSVIDFVSRPISLKGRAYIGMSNGGFSGQLNVNFTDSYTNIAADPEEPVDSWTTVDLNLRYAFDGRRSQLLKDTAVSVNINNLFDTDPPSVGPAEVGGLVGLGVPAGFDPVNANPVGRFITFGLRKQF